MSTWDLALSNLKPLPPVLPTSNRNNQHSVGRSVYAKDHAYIKSHYPPEQWKRELARLYDRQYKINNRKLLAEKMQRGRNK